MFRKFLAISVLIIVLGVVFQRANETPARAAYSDYQPCPSSIIVTNPLPNQVVSGSLNLTLSPVTNPVTSVVFYANNIGLGNASSVSGVWQKPWASTQLQNNQYGMWALITFSTTASSTITQCRTAQFPFTVFNTTNSTESVQELIVEPGIWTGPTNVTAEFNAKLRVRTSSGTISDVSSQASFSWSTTIGSVESNRPKVFFSSGPSSGSGTITVTAGYAGKTTSRTINVLVANSTQTSTYPVINNQTTNSQGTPTASPAIPSATLEALKQGDSKLTSCLKQSIGDKAGSRMSFRDFAQTKDCFKDRRFVVPANLAPVAPAKVKQLPETIEVSINSIKTEGTGSDQKIVFSGRAKANQQVFIYIFSEPLVLTAQANKDGQWSYTLEDPLASGEHEAFIAVEKNSSEAARSAGSVFGIQAVAATPDNPTGLSLLIEQQKSQPISLYIFSTLAMIVLSFGLLLIIRHKRHNALHGTELLPAANEVMPPPAPIAPPPPAIEKEPTLTDSPEEINEKSL